jgi:hypothetical protein
MSNSQKILCLLVSLAPLVLVYYPVLGFQLLWDDYSIRIFHNYYSTNNLLNTAFLQKLGINEFYRPIPCLVMAIESKWAGMQYEGEAAHLFNLFLLILNTTLTGYLAKIYYQGEAKSALYVSMAASIGYSLHPALLSCFGFVSTRFDIMMTFFLLCIMIVEKNPARSLSKDILIAMLMFMAVCSKEYAVVVIPVFILMKVRDETHNEPGHTHLPALLLRHLAKNAGHILFYIIPVAIYLGLRFWSGVFWPNTGAGHPALSALDYFLRAAQTLGMVIHLTLLPHNFIKPAYPPLLPLSVFDPHSILGIAVIITGSITYFYSSTKNRISIIIFAVLLLPFLVSWSPQTLFWPWYLCFPLALFFGTVFPSLVQFLQACKWPKTTHALIYTCSFLWITGGIYQNHSHLQHWRNAGTFFSWWMMDDPSSAYAAENYQQQLMYSEDPRTMLNSTALLLSKHNQSSILYLLAAKSALRLGDIQSANNYVLKGISNVIDKNIYARLLCLAADIAIEQGDIQTANSLINQVAGIGTEGGSLLATTVNYALATGNLELAKSQFKHLNEALGNIPEVRAAKLAGTILNESDIDTLRERILALDQKN